jgi:hypothetical protein
MDMPRGRQGNWIGDRETKMESLSFNKKGKDSILYEGTPLEIVYLLSSTTTLPTTSNHQLQHPTTSQGMNETE